jgi:hypothetical protein
VEDSAQPGLERLRMGMEPGHLLERLQIVEVARPALARSGRVEQAHGAA